jgi:TPR repeat protein
VREAPSEALVAVLISRGDALLGSGDISAARLLYLRAAEGGSARAALAVAKTFDEAFLAEIGARGGIRGDREQASIWYRRAAELGDAEAARRLNALASGRSR